MRACRAMLAGLFVAAVLPGACSSGPPLPRHRAMTGAESLRTIAERLESVRTFSAACDLIMTDAAGQTVRLEGAVAAEPPSRVRLRAWKLGRAVFDVTMLDEQIWVVMPEEHGAGVPTGDLREVAGLMGPAFFRGAAVEPAQTTAERLVASGVGPGGSTVLCEIDRPTLTPRVYAVRGRPREEGSVVLDRYALVGDTPWPMRARVRHAGGEVVVTFRDAQINGGLPEGALTPPRRAVLRP